MKAYDSKTGQLVGIVVAASASRVRLTSGIDAWTQSTAGLVIVPSECGECDNELRLAEVCPCQRDEQGA